MDLYADNILDHYKHPRHSGKIAKPTVSHREENISCGDDMTIDLEIENGMIKDLKWHGQGCAISQAAMSLLSEELIGKTVNEIESMKPDEIYALLGVPVGPRRFKCALLCLHTLKNALRASQSLEPQSWIETVSLESE
jgi:nitrogen fixation NifU-like protein